MIDLTVQSPTPARLDRWLASQFPDRSRSHLQKLIDQGQVSLNGQTCRKNSVVQRGDQIHITLEEPEPLNLAPEPIPLTILYEDSELVIVNKPAGMVVHPSAGHNRGTLVHALLAHCPDLAGIGGVERPGIVHRLDKDTTGAIVIAKTDRAMIHLQQQIQTKTAQRQYLAVVYGAPRQDCGTIEQPLGRHPVDRKKMAILPEEKGGRRAITHWQVRERLGNFTLMEFRLDTGRTHQIRVHSLYLGHPIVGDPLYGSGHSVGVNLPGQALHAWRLQVQHPVSEEEIVAIAPTPSAFVTLLEVLRKRIHASD